jgi:hypothetical protein
MLEEDSDEEERGIDCALNRGELEPEGIVCMVARPFPGAHIAGSDYLLGNRKLGPIATGAREKEPDGQLPAGQQPLGIHQPPSTPGCFT